MGVRSKLSFYYTCKSISNNPSLYMSYDPLGRSLAHGNVWYAKLLQEKYGNILPVLVAKRSYTGSSDALNAQHWPRVHPCLRLNAQTWSNECHSPRHSHFRLFSLATSFLNGKPLVLLSAPVLLLICDPPANIKHHNPTALRLADPTKLNAKADWSVET